jgi:hypothetical protein
VNQGAQDRVRHFPRPFAQPAAKASGELPPAPVKIRPRVFHRPGIEFEGDVDPFTEADLQVRPLGLNPPNDPDVFGRQGHELRQARNEGGKSLIPPRFVQLRQESPLDNC